MSFEREAKLTKLGSHPGEEICQVVIQCSTGIIAQTGVQKDKTGDNQGKKKFSTISSMLERSQGVYLGAYFKTSSKSWNFLRK
ncbi:hypothetical protein DSO57_1036669 [Entomophthora muscae]|uniref:Uncharacterized protein n=1 Tax=Entomophthora muscae TaxID=34485 RepID=A0ACC2SZA4_9FUNG|nr:hypothetical protein DSO57_1036669 [Entomophthora muscae]